MRLPTGTLCALLLLTGCSAADDETAARPSEQRTDPTGTTRDDGGAAVQPPADGPLPDTRTGALPMPGAPCVISAGDAPATGRAFDGTITAVGPDGATFEVHEVFRGTVADTVTVDLGPPRSSGASESGPSYAVGTRLLVTARGRTALGCGDTVYFDEETADAWRS